MKISRTNYGLEQQIIEAIYALRDKKSSDIFKDPVDVTKVPDYYEKIKNPMDLSTIQKKLKNGSYHKAEEVHRDLQLIVENCKAYNTYNPNITKKAEQFSECIKTVWGNFRKEIDRKMISYEKSIQINEEILKRIAMIEEKKNRRKNASLLINMEQEKKNILPTSSILPPLELELQKNERDQLPPQLQFSTEKYSQVSKAYRKQITSLSYTEQELKSQFEKLAERKLKKYRNILRKRLQWFDEKIIQKCLQKKRFKKMIVPTHLSNLMDKGLIAENLNIRKLQLYIKQITYWVEDNSNILNDYMKDRFVENCKLTKKCILRVLKYKKIPRQRNLLDAQLYGMEIPLNMDDGIDIDREDDNYDNKMKQFKRLLERDRAESTKRDTKIILRNQNGEMQVIDWTSDKKQQRARKEGGGTPRVDMTDNDQKRKLEEKRKEEIRRDEDFLQNYSKKSNTLLIGKFGDKLCIDWNVVTFPDVELPMEINFNYTDDDS